MSTTIELINTGILMGIVHVLTGPDHLSALATLNGMNISTHSNNNCDSFLLGIKWGLGHSLGLLVVGGALIIMEESGSEWISMSSTQSMVLESFVGVFMLFLGTYGLYRACSNRSSDASSEFGRSLSVDFPAKRRNSSRRPPTQIDDSDYSGGNVSDDYSSEEDDSFIEKKRDREMPLEHRRTSMDISQMAEALNRDGDSMRDMGSVMEDDFNASAGSGTLASTEELERRIFHAAKSLRQNSSISNSYDEQHSVQVPIKDVEQQQQTSNQFNHQRLKASARGALSQSFMAILTDRPRLMRAKSVMHKHAAPENAIAKNVDMNKTYSSKRDRCRKVWCCNLLSTGMLAIIAGIIQGVAGPGGVLGVIPAVQLKDARLATLYLSTFCVTSTLVMGGFAASYGRFSEWLAGGSERRSMSRVFMVECGSALLSLIVGVLWLTLLSVGALQEVFP